MQFQFQCPIAARLVHVNDTFFKAAHIFAHFTASKSEFVHHQQGRAYLEAKIKLKEKRYNNVEGGIMKIVVDGYNAPVTAGAFVDLVEKKFYDGMEVQRSDGLVVQTGRPEGDVSLCSLHVLPLKISPSLPFCLGAFAVSLGCVAPAVSHRCAKILCKLEHAHREPCFWCSEALQMPLPSSLYKQLEAVAAAGVSAAKQQWDHPFT